MDKDCKYCNLLDTSCYLHRDYLKNYPYMSVRKFESGATRDTDINKYDYESFLSPIVLERFARYMEKHRIQSDGAVRNSDNWQKGIPKEAYIKSGLRHVMDWWLFHRGFKGRESLEDALCGIMFNVMGYLFELIREKDERVEE